MPLLGLHAKPLTGVVSLQWFGNEQIAAAFDAVVGCETRCNLAFQPSLEAAGCAVSPR